MSEIKIKVQLLKLPGRNRHSLLVKTFGKMKTDGNFVQTSGEI